MSVKASIELSEGHSCLVDINESEMSENEEHENSPINIHIIIGVITLYTIYSLLRTTSARPKD